MRKKEEAEQREGRELGNKGSQGEGMGRGKRGGVRWVRKRQVDEAVRKKEGGRADSERDLGKEEGGGSGGEGKG